MKLNRSWLMTLCVVGMGALFFLPALGISIGSLFAFLLILLCPLSHLLMMRGAHGGHGGHHHGGSTPERPASGVPTALPTEEEKALKG
ncbi:MAG TPA: DUF2933 domain-containing protein [Candidatus Methylomirabilis sp.]|nr:DUF2933 domain-containing protein [Candidatus Methylomirabilis sp.]HSC71862.1 DUF2933 domain-containing protein [Candidatus Methylomirabilis sp.]